MTDKDVMDLFVSNIIDHNNPFHYLKNLGCVYKGRYLLCSWTCEKLHATSEFIGEIYPHTYRSRSRLEALFFGSI